MFCKTLDSVASVVVVAAAAVDTPNKVDSLTWNISTEPDQKSTSTYQNTRQKPDKSRQKAKGFSSFKVTTQVIVANVAPGKGTAAVEIAQSIDLETESSEPAECDDDINLTSISTQPWDTIKK